MSLTGSSLTLFPVNNASLGVYGPLGGGAEMEEVYFWKQSSGVLSLATSYLTFCFLVSHEVNSSPLPFTLPPPPPAMMSFSKYRDPDR